MATKSGSDVAVCRLVLQAVSETLRTNKRLLEKSARFTGAITTEPSCDAVTCFLVLYYTFLLFKIPDIFFYYSAIFLLPHYLYVLIYPALS